MALVTRQSISVIFPAYNEEGNIAHATNQAIWNLRYLSGDWQIIIVDDGSGDNTGQIADKISARNKRVTVVHHDENKGYGAALKSGIRKAEKELIFFSDSDLQFHLSEILLTFAWIEQYDMVIGYRARRKDPIHRRLNAHGWNVLVRALLGLHVRDIDCAFKLFRSTVFNTIEIDAVGAMVNTDILVQAVRMGYKIKEIPVTHFPRLNGKQTGANIRVVLKAFRELYLLQHKLRDVQRLVMENDRRIAHLKRADLPERRKGERRKVLLPINFADRRKRHIKLDGSANPHQLPLCTPAEAIRGYR